MEEFHDNSREAKLARQWDVIRNAFGRALAASAQATVSFPDVINQHAEGWRGNFTGDVVDVGEDEVGQWVDMRIISHVRTHDNAVDSRLDLEDYLEGVSPPDAETWLDSDHERWQDAHVLNSEIQGLVGDEEQLDTPPGISRFYSEQMGTMAVVTIK